MDANHFWSVRQELADLGFQLLREVLQLRTKARLQPLSGPHQSRADWCEAGSAALLPFDQWRFEECRPRFDQIPGMPVRHAFALRSMNDLSGDADLIQKITVCTWDGHQQ